MTFLYARWRFDNYTQDQKSNFTNQIFFLKKFRETLFISMLHSFHFDEIFHRKFKTILVLLKKFRETLFTSKLHCAELLSF